MVVSSFEPGADELSEFDDDSLATELGSTDSLHTFSSPVLRKMVRNDLTLSFLAVHVPVFQKGEKAREKLAAGGGDPAQLQPLVDAGTVAKETLVHAAIPLVRLLANREFERRGGHGRVRATRDELFQEGVIGLFAGLRKYDPKGGQKSPTNYLGAWVTMAIRRGTDSGEHDFTLGYVAAERYRRIYAIRSRLHAELGRDASDNEIIAAWNDPQYLTGRMMGRLSQGESKNTVTVKQLAEERQYSSRMGVHAAPVDAAGDMYGFDAATPVGNELVDEMTAPVDEVSAKQHLASVLEYTMQLLGVGVTQRTIIGLKFGLDGHDEHPVAAIMAGTGLSRAKVAGVVDAFTAEMTKKGGAFHKVCSRLPSDELESLGLTWVTSVLGEYTYKQIGRIAVLSDDMVKPLGKPPPPPITPGERPGQIRAQFQCPIHQWGFVGAYKDRGDVPRVRACPRCDRNSPLIRVLQT